MEQPLTFDLPDFVPPTVACFGKKYTKKWQNSVKTLRTYAYWRQLFFTAAITRFRWEGLPNGVDARYLEIMLCGYGAFAVTKRGARDGVLPYIAGRMTPIGNRDLYNNPNALQVITPNGAVFRRHANWWVDKTGSNGYKRKEALRPADAAVCWDNLARMPILSILDLQANRLAEMDVTVDTHTRAMRTPYVLTVDEGGEANAQRMYNEIESGKPAIFSYRKGGMMDAVTVLQTMPASGYAGDKLLNDMLKIVSQVYTFLGIDNNAAAEKKERVQTSETLANNEQFLIQREASLRCRRDFLSTMRRLFPEDWADATVEWAIPHVSESSGEVMSEESGLWNSGGGGLTFDFGKGEKKR